ncbi:hypothetical protein ANO14919_005200 [Xylariales sp. No.14919]|nr:hypothetical protein F5X98DRAFT_156938 [Xylaria grammica]GAW11178.1 hypothetical protein ANO14919_005200 [Xylariales sp. No.14919]
MDDTTTLVSELLSKLAELDQKVCDYRQGMAHEFQRYLGHLLQDAPEDVSARVEKVLADELHNYSALGPGLLALDGVSADLGRPAVERRPRRGRVSPPPVLPHTSGVPPNDNTSGSPPDRDREREFHGLFTPSYLPLLEVVQPNKAIPSPTAALLPATSRDNVSNDTQESLSHAQLGTTARRPDPVRRHTEETASSINSDDSVSRTRRSALRRSSSGSTKDTQSPRRVRFDVEGEEVLPTASPPTSPRIDELLTSPPPEGQVTPIRESLNRVVVEEEASILGNSPPRPKKISSTERLKALARNSTEDTSKWTVVGDTHDDDEEEEGLVMFSSKKKPNAPAMETAPTTALKNGTGSYHIQKEGLKDLRIETYGSQSIGEDEVVDGVFELPPLTSFKDKKMFSPQPHAQNIGVRSKEKPELRQALPSSTLSLPSFKAQNFEEEDLFGFDDEESDMHPQTMTTTKYIEEEPEAREQATSITANLAEEPPITLYSTSPAVPIAKPASPPPASPVSPTSSVSKQIGASAGSYKGKPFIIGVVRNEELYKKASEMGDFSMFVGSVDGRSGVDASDSYRQDPYCFNGTPRSLGERLMEEAHARRIADSARKQE